MPDDQAKSVKFEELRRQAEELIKQHSDFDPEIPDNILDLIHDLKIHHAELKIQNIELQRAQREISTLQREYEYLYEFAPCGYLTLNNKGIISQINLTGIRFLGTTREYAKHQGFTQFITSGWENVFLSARKKCVQTGEKQSIELRLKQNDDSPLWVRADIEADRDDTGSVLQWRMVLLDISSKIESESALKRSEAKYRQMMESISDPVSVCSPDLKIEYMNPPMIKRLGRNATGETCYRAMHGVDQVCEWCPIKKVGKGKTIDEIIESPLDNRTYRLTHMPIRNDDHTVSKLTMYRDITDYLAVVEEKETAKANLIQAQKMESVGRLAAGMAHEINNPLAGVIQNSNVLAKRLIDIMMPDNITVAESIGTTMETIHEFMIKREIPRIVKAITESGIRIASIVENMLTFARKSDSSFSIHDPAKLIDQTLELASTEYSLKKKYDFKSITIEKEYENNLPMLACEGNKIQQVVLNLLSNGAHAMCEKKSTHNRYKPKFIIRISHEIEYHMLRVEIEDNGPGINKNTQKKIFEPFFTTKPVGAGTGLGLSVSYFIVTESHNGIMEVESEPEKGAKFIIRLPIERKTKMG